MKKRRTLVPLFKTARPLKASKAVVLAEAIRCGGGKLHRFTGGYWSFPGNVGAPRDERFSVDTVDELVDDGLLRFTAYKEKHGSRFPIVAEVVE